MRGRCRAARTAVRAEAMLTMKTTIATIMKTMPGARSERTGRVSQLPGIPPRCLPCTRPGPMANSPQSLRRPRRRRCHRVARALPTMQPTRPPGSGQARRPRRRPRRRSGAAVGGSWPRARRWKMPRTGERGALGAHRPTTRAPGPAPSRGLCPGVRSRAPPPAHARNPVMQKRRRKKGRRNRNGWSA